MEAVFRCNEPRLVDVSTLIPHPKNNNKHSKAQIERLAKIIEYQGFRNPIVVSDLSGFMTKGHARLDAVKLLGWEKVPADLQHYETESQEYADLIADNSIALWADFDLPMVNSELPDLGPDFDLDHLGIKDFKLDPSEKPKIKLLTCPKCNYEFDGKDGYKRWQPDHG